LNEVTPADGTGSTTVALNRQIRRGMNGLRAFSEGVKQKLDEQSSRRAAARGKTAVMISRADARLLRLDRGHPRLGLLYVGHPTKSTVYFPAAEFHRRVFEDKFIEAVTLLMSLGASRISVEQEHGHTRDEEQTLLPLGFERKKHDKATGAALFEGEFPGSGTPEVPPDLTWFDDEPTWKMLAEARTSRGAERWSLVVNYTTDYGIDMHVVDNAISGGLNIGGKFAEAQHIVWRLSAEFPPKL
jgi:hypothetical protein